ncbi:hypothetical protein ABZS79_13885 [Streptomyces griseoloalbus]|uniref:hypothetical protein n=1 Tax=Streptomyces griseoloalbus TaxID=67303 RepID=UPI0033A38DA3
MNSRGNTLKLTAVSALVVLTLTGFSTGRGGSSGGGDGSGGGGCSSSSQNHDSSGSGGSHNDYDDDYDDDTGSVDAGADASSPELGATVELVSCASQTAPYATVEVSNPNTASGSFTVTVTFVDASGAEVTAPAEDVYVPGNDTVTARVDIGDSQLVPRVADCDPDPYAPTAV